MLVAWRTQYLPGTQEDLNELSIIFKLRLLPETIPSKALYNPKKKMPVFPAIQWELILPLP